MPPAADLALDAAPTPSPAPDYLQASIATRLAFLAAGFVMACWAPLIPFVKANANADEAKLGLLLLCLGIGSVIAMPMTGYFSARTGAKPMILLGGIGLVIILPVLAGLSAPLALAAALLLFGASLGTIDVAMNVHAAEIERARARPLMSGFHAMWSVGGVLGAGGMTLLLSIGFSPVAGAMVGSALALAALLYARPRFLVAQGGEAPAFVRPRGIVLLLAVLAGITFLVEGAVLDWSALLIVERGLLEPAMAGLGYMLFSVAMTVGRLTGDRTVSLLGPRRVLLWGGIVTIAGFAVLLLTDRTPVAMSGFVLIGLGAANLVPVVFSAAGQQSIMPPGLAIAAVTTTGYAGILLGPAAMGFVSHATSLPAAFWMLVALTAIVPLCARVATSAR
jgi:predicted MFS family arabinose efflux permease